MPSPDWHRWSRRCSRGAPIGRQRKNIAGERMRQPDVEISNASAANRAGDTVTDADAARRAFGACRRGMDELRKHPGPMADVYGRKIEHCAGTRRGERDEPEIRKTGDQSSPLPP